MKKEIITFKEPKSPISEIFRTLRTNIQFMNTKKVLKSLLITSTSPGEGKSWISSNIAVAFAQAGKKVILVDADMRKGRQFSIFGVPPTPGLSNYLSGISSSGGESSANILTYVHETEVENLYIIPAGNIPPNPSELLVSDQMTTAMEALKEICDLIIFDGTPSDLVTDAIIISRYVDTTLIVTSYKQTKIDGLEKIKRDIENVGGKIAGTVINKIPVSHKEYYSTYYYYGNTNLKINKKSKIPEKESKLDMERKKEEAKVKIREILKQNRENSEVSKADDHAENTYSTQQNVTQSDSYNTNKEEENNSILNKQDSQMQTEVSTDFNDNNSTKSDGVENSEQLIKQVNN